MDALLRQVCLPPSDGASHTVVVLRDRPDGKVARATDESGRSVIVKLWKRPGLNGLIRRLTRTGSVLREYRTLDLLHRAGMKVPAPLGYRKINLDAVDYTDALFVEDIGECVTALSHVKRLIAENRQEELTAFEDDLVEMTAALIDAGVVDPDHGMLNVVVLPNGRPVRLDFEIARRVIYPALATKAYGDTLGRLIASYTFAVQPDVNRVREFAKRLKDQLDPPAAALKRCKWYVKDRLDRQRREIQLDVNVDLPW